MHRKVSDVRRNVYIIEMMVDNQDGKTEKPSESVKLR